MDDVTQRRMRGPLLAVAGGGAVGAILRYLFAMAFSHDPGAFAWATFTENVIGSLLLGFAMVVILNRRQSTSYSQPFFCTGVLGSFTTFSNYSVEIVGMLENGRPMLGVLYAGGSIMAGLLAAMAGMLIARAISPRHLDHEEQS